MRPELLVAAGGAGAIGAAACGRAARADRPGVRPAASHAPPAPGRWWAEVLDDLGVEGDPVRWGRVGLGAGALGVGLGAVEAGGAGVVAALVVLGVAAVATRRGLAGRGARRADADLPDLLEHAGRGLRSGLDLAGALRAAGATVGGRHGAALVEVVGRLDAGAPLDDALAPWVEAHRRPAVRITVAAVAVAGAAGGRPARALDGVAATLRARAAVAGEARALASQAHASAVVLVALPLVVAVGGAAADDRVASALLATGWGRSCAAGALLLDAVGAWWMHRVVTAGGR